MNENEKRVNELTTRVEMLELENKGLRGEIKQISKVDDEQRKTIQDLRRQTTQLHIQLSQLKIEAMNERLDRIQERQKTMKEKEYEFSEFWWNHYGIDIDALDDEVYMEMINYLNSIAKYQKGE